MNRLVDYTFITFIIHLPHLQISFLFQVCPVLLSQTFSMNWLTWLVKPVWMICSWLKSFNFTADMDCIIVLILICEWFVLLSQNLLRHLLKQTSFEFNLFRESFKPVYKTSLKVSLKNRITPFRDYILVTVCSTCEWFILVCKSFKTVHKTDFEQFFHYHVRWISLQIQIAFRFMNDSRVESFDDSFQWIIWTSS